MFGSTVTVVALSRFPVAGLVWRFRSGIWTVTVVCRVSFALHRGQVDIIREQQEPIAQTLAYPGGTSSGVYAPSDLVPMKPRAEVLVLGSAHASQRQPARSLVARVRLGEVDKSLESWKFAGFGPVDPTTPARRALLGSYAGTMGVDMPSGAVLPMDVDLAYFNAAPGDQQLAALEEGATLTLENLHPEHPQLVTRLPVVRPYAVLEGPERTADRVHLRPDTVWIDTDHGLGAVTYRACIPFGNEQGLHVLIGADDASLAPSASDLAETVVVPRGPKPKTLPFRRGDAPPGPLALEASPALPRAVPAAPALVPLDLQVREPVAAVPVEIAPPALLAAPVPALVPPQDSAQPAADKPLVSPWALGAVAANLAALEPERDAGVGPLRAPLAEPAILADAVSLLGVDEEGMPEIHASGAFEAILASLSVERRTLAEDTEHEEKVADAEDANDILDLLASEPTTDERALAAALAKAASEGYLVHPVLPIAGELQLPFDELEVLKATMAAAAPKLAGDAVAIEAMGVAKAFVTAPGAPSRAVSAALAVRLRETMVARKLVPAASLEDITREALLEAQAHGKRVVLGAPHVRALLRLIAPSESDPGSPQAKEPKPPIVVYLPDAIASKLPSVEQLRVRMLVRAHPSIDPSEAQPLALTALAVALVSPPIAVEESA